MNIGEVIAANALYGTTLTASKILVSFAPPVFLIGIRMTIAGSLLLAYQFLVKKKSLCLNTSHWVYLIQIALFNIYLPYVLRYWSLQYLSVSKSALFFNLTPLVSYVISYILGLQKQSLTKWAGITIGMLGFLPMILSKESVSVSNCSTNDILSLPELAMFGAIVSLSYSWIVVQKAARMISSPITINGLSMLIGGILALITSFYTEKVLIKASPYELIGWLSFVIIVTNFICYNWQIKLLRKFSATVMALAGLAAPLVATITSIIFLGENLTWQFCLATAMLGLGIWIFYQTEANQLPELAE